MTLQSVPEAPREGASRISIANPDVLAALEARFPSHSQDPEVNKGLPFITVAQVAHRLNEVLGIGNWTHRIVANTVTGELQWGHDRASDEVWCYGRLEGVIDSQPFVREAIGSIKVKRSRTAGADGVRPPNNFYDELKGAQSDSLKKAAQALGVGSYLQDKEILQALKNEILAARTGRTARSGLTTIAGATGAGVSVAGGEPGPGGSPLACQGCGHPLPAATRFANNDTWTAQELARRTQLKHGKVLCMDCHKQANQEKAAAVGSRVPSLRRGAAPPAWPAEGG